MLRFKQFISVYLTEAKAEHFAHIGLDINDPHHRDMLDMFNKHTHMMPKKNPNQYKSLEELHAAVKPHLDELTRQREEEHQQQQALQSGDAELVHHDPSTGLKVFKVKSGKGCHAVGSDTKWCTAHPETGDTAFQGYDPEGKHSYVIHTPEKGNLSKIGIIGVKPGEKHKSDLGGNFQDKGNVTVTDSDWENLRKKYNLDSVKALHGIRGLYNPERAEEEKEEVRKIVRPDMTDKELGEIKSDNPAVHEAMLNHENAGQYTHHALARQSDDPEIYKKLLANPELRKETIHRISESTYKSSGHRMPEEIQDLITSHKNSPGEALGSVADYSEDNNMFRKLLDHPNITSHALYHISGKSKDPDIHRKIMDVLQKPETDHYGEFYPHIKNNLIRNSDDPEIHKKILSSVNPGYRALDAIAEKSNDPEILKKILSSEDVSSAGLHSLSNKLGPEYHKSIASHVNVSDDMLTNFARTSDDPEIHKIIAKKGKEDALYLLSIRSTDPEIHKIIANNRFIPSSVVKHLAMTYGMPNSYNTMEISDRIDDHIKNQKNNPYQIESTENIYKTIKNILKGE